MDKKNIHKKGYDFELLQEKHPELKPFIKEKEDGNKSLKFSDPLAIIELNKALLKVHYQIYFWDIPKGYLCPGIPGRANYVHSIADLLSVEKEIPRGNKVRCLDIGTGSSVIYPLLGHSMYRWKFVASEIDSVSVRCAKGIVEANDLKKVIDVRKQMDATFYMQDIIREGEFYNAVFCNPPFYSSAEDAAFANAKKNKNLNLQQTDSLNFGGVNNELWCQGGEFEFIKGLMKESQHFQKQLHWITTLVSDKKNVDGLIDYLEFLNVTEHRIISLETGNKISRILAWRFT